MVDSWFHKLKLSTN